MADRDLHEVIDGFRDALRVYVRGDSDPVAGFFSQRDDVTLANPLGPPRRGPSDVMSGIIEGAANFKEGGSLVFEEVSSRLEEIARYATPELGYVVQIERHEGRVAGRDDPVVISLRVTMIFRPEDGAWKIGSFVDVVGRGLSHFSWGRSNSIGPQHSMTMAATAWAEWKP